MVADDGCVTMLCSAGNQVGHVFDPHIVAGFVWSFDQEQVNVMKAVTFLANVQRNETTLIAATEYINADGGVLFFKFGDVFDGHWEGEAGSVQGVFVGLVVGESIWVMCTRMKGCQDGPDETLRVGGVLNIYNGSFVGQPWGRGNVTGAV